MMATIPAKQGPIRPHAPAVALWRMNVSEVLRRWILGRFGLAGKDLLRLFPIQTGLVAAYLAGILLNQTVVRDFPSGLEWIGALFNPIPGLFYAIFLLFSLVTGLVLSSSESDDRTWRLLGTFPISPRRLFWTKFIVGTATMVASMLLFQLGLSVLNMVFLPGPPYEFDRIAADFDKAVAALVTSGGDLFPSRPRDIVLPGVLGLVVLGILGVTIAVGSACASLNQTAVALLAVLAAGALLVDQTVGMAIVYGHAGSIMRYMGYLLLLALSAPLWTWGLRAGMLREQGLSWQAILPPWMGGSFGGGFASDSIATGSKTPTIRSLRDPGFTAARRNCDIFSAILSAALVYLALIGGVPLHQQPVPEWIVLIVMFAAPFAIGLSFASLAELQPVTHVSGLLPQSPGRWIARRLALIATRIAVPLVLFVVVHWLRVSPDDFQPVMLATFFMLFCGAGLAALCKTLLLANLPAAFLAPLATAAIAIMALIPDRNGSYVDFLAAISSDQRILPGKSMIDWTPTPTFAIFWPTLIWQFLVVVVLPFALLAWAWTKTGLAGESPRRRRAAAIPTILALLLVQHFLSRTPPQQVLSVLLTSVGLGG